LLQVANVTKFKYRNHSMLIYRNNQENFQNNQTIFKITNVFLFYLHKWLVF